MNKRQIKKKIKNNFNIKIAYGKELDNIAFLYGLERSKFFVLPYKSIKKKEKIVFEDDESFRKRCLNYLRATTNISFSAIQNNKEQNMLKSMMNYEVKYD